MYVQIIHLASDIFRVSSVGVGVDTQTHFFLFILGLGVDTQTDTHTRKPKNMGIIPNKIPETQIKSGFNNQISSNSNFYFFIDFLIFPEFVEVNDPDF